MLGAGREKKEDDIDMLAGLYLAKKEGDRVEAGEILALLYTCEEQKLEAAQERLASCYRIGGEKPASLPLILAKVTTDRVERYDG